MTLLVQINRIQNTVYVRVSFKKFLTIYKRTASKSASSEKKKYFQNVKQNSNKLCMELTVFVSIYLIFYIYYIHMLFIERL